MKYFDCKFKRQPFSGTMTFKTVEPFFQWIGVQPHVLWLYEPPHVPGSIVCGKRRGWDLSLLPSDSCLLSRECSQESNNNSDKQPLWFESIHFLYLYLSHSVYLCFNISIFRLISHNEVCFVVLSPNSFSFILTTLGKRSCYLTEQSKTAILTTYSEFSIFL